MLGVSELHLTAGCVLMDLASPAVSGTSVYANGINSFAATIWNKLISFLLKQGTQMLQMQNVLCLLSKLEQVEMC